MRWGYSVPQGRTVRRERSGLREPPVPRKLELVVPAVRLQPREHQEHLVRRVSRMQALPVVSAQLVLGAHSVRRARLCPYWLEVRAQPAQQVPWVRWKLQVLPVLAV